MSRQPEAGSARGKSPAGESSQGYPSAGGKQAGQTGAPYGLPGYVWDPRMQGGRYRDALTGRLVPRSRIINLLRQFADGFGDRVARLAESAAKGEIRAAVFEVAIQQEVKRAYLCSAALGAGGWDRLGPYEWGRIGGTLRGEYRYLSRFAAQLAAGELSPAAAAARARLYAGKAYSQYWHVARERAVAGGLKEEKWESVGDERVCPDCDSLDAMGWVPIGTHPVPGEGRTQCLGACRCDVLYR